MVRTDFFLDQWQVAREDVALAVEDLPAGKLDYRPQDDMMAFREVARHILDIGRSLVGLLVDGETDFASPDFRQKAKTYSQPAPDDAAGLAEALRSAVREHCAALAKQPDSFYDEMITRWDGLRLTRGEMLQLVKEHEMTHRMQLFMYLRLNGVVPPTTRRRMAKTS